MYIKTRTTRNIKYIGKKLLNDNYLMILKDNDDLFQKSYHNNIISKY